MKGKLFKRQIVCPDECKQKGAHRGEHVYVILSKLALQLMVLRGQRMRLGLFRISVCLIGDLLNCAAILSNAIACKRYQGRRQDYRCSDGI